MTRRRGPDPRARAFLTRSAFAMNDDLERTFDRWRQEAAGHPGAKRIGLAAWGDAATGGNAADAPPTVGLMLPKGLVFADRYVSGVLADERLVVTLRLGLGVEEGGPGPGRACWLPDREPLSEVDLATLLVLAVREAHHAGRRLAPACGVHGGDGFTSLSLWLLPALEADEGGLAEAVRRLEPRAFAWWGAALEAVGEPAAARRARVWQTLDAGEGVADAAVAAWVDLAADPMATAPGRLAALDSAQHRIDGGGFRDFDLQTRIDLERAGSLAALGYRPEAMERLREVRQRLLANPGLGAARLTVRAARVARRGGGVLAAAALPLAVASGVLRSPTARLKLARELAARRLRNDRARRPLGAAVSRGPNADGGIRRVVLLRLDRLGDLVCVQPAVERIAERFPTAELELWVTRGLESLADRLHPRVRGVGVDARSPAGLRSAIAQAAAAGPFDLLVDLLEPDRAEQIRVGRAFRAGLRVGFDTPARRESFTHRVPQPARPMHVVDRTSLLLRPLGVPVPDDAGWAPRLRPEPDAVAAARRALGAEAGRPLVVLHLGAGWRYKRWYPARFAAVGRALAASRAAVVRVLHGPGEVEAREAAAAAAEIGPDARAAAALLPGLIDQLAAADLFLGNDSGPMHAAAAVGTPVVAAWGAGDFGLFAPRSSDAPVRVVRDQPRCANCPQEVDSPRCPMGFAYEEVPCLTAVSVAAVTEACEALLD